MKTFKIERKPQKASCFSSSHPCFIKQLFDPLKFSSTAKKIWHYINSWTAILECLQAKRPPWTCRQHKGWRGEQPAPWKTRRTCATNYKSPRGSTHLPGLKVPWLSAGLHILPCLLIIVGQLIIGQCKENKSLKMNKNCCYKKGKRVYKSAAWEHFIDFLFIELFWT